MTRQDTRFWEIWENLEAAGQHPRTGPKHPRCRVIDADPRCSGLSPVRVYVSPAGSWTHDESRSWVLR